MVEIRPVYYFIITRQGKVIIELNKAKYLTYILSDKKILPKRLFKKIISVEFINMNGVSNWEMFYHDPTSCVRVSFSENPEIWWNALQKPFLRNYPKWRKNNGR